MAACKCSNVESTEVRRQRRFDSPWQTCKGVLALVMATGLLSVPTAKAADKDIVDTAVANSNFSTLVTALQETGLAAALRADGPFTVFAPTDEAFAKLPAGTVESLLEPENRDVLKRILLFHVVSGDVRSRQLVGMPSATTLNGQRLQVALRDGRAKVNDSAILTPDITCENGVIHVIDSVLLPAGKDIVTLAGEAGVFSTLAKALTEAGLVEALQGDGPFTVFAPTDDAFAALPEGTVETLLKPENKEQLIGILKYHVVAGRVYAEQAIKAGLADTLQGEALEFGIEGGRARVNGINLIGTDLDAANGVVHMIDQVLLPPSLNGGKAPDPRPLIELAIRRGAPQFNDGNEDACAEIYEITVAGLLLLGRDAINAEERVRLQKGMAEYESADNGSRKAWSLRRTLDDVYASLTQRMQDQAGARRTSTSPHGNGTNGMATQRRSARLIADFSDAGVSSRWVTVNDNVMGGRSRGGFSFSDDKLIFSGSTNTNGGGFSSIRTRPRDFGIDDAEGLEIRVRGDGRTYKMDVRNDERIGGMSVSYWANFETSGDWEVIRIPFSSFEPTFFGERLRRSSKSFDPADMTAMGFFIYDKKDGPFRLEIDWIRAF
ncbi:MAG: CIA30 family protein [Phycisphaerae bacterium]